LIEIDPVVSKEKIFELAYAGQADGQTRSTYDNECQVIAKAHLTLVIRELKKENLQWETKIIMFIIKYYIIFLSHVYIALKKVTIKTLFN
jgi:hypothetical protein